MESAKKIRTTDAAFENIAFGGLPRHLGRTRQQRRHQESRLWLRMSMRVMMTLGMMMKMTVPIGTYYCKHLIYIPLLCP